MYSVPSSKRILGQNTLSIDSLIFHFLCSHSKMGLLSYLLWDDISSKKVHCQQINHNTKEPSFQGGSQVFCIAKNTTYYLLRKPY